MPPRAKSDTVEEIDLDTEENPADTGLLLATNPSATVTPKNVVDFKGFVGASRPLAMQAGVGVLGFLGGNWFREQVSLRAINAVWKTATPGQGLFVDTLIQLFVAWQIARRSKGLGKALAFGILVNQGIAIGKHFSKANPGRFDVTLFNGGGAAPAPSMPNGGADQTSGIMPSRRMSGIMPATRVAA